MQQVPPLLSSMQIIFRKSVLSAQAREEMTHEALKMGAKYIWYVDDDTIPPPKALYELHNQMELHPEASAISGVYVTREQCPEPLLYKKHGEGAFWDFSVQPGVLTPIWAGGAGCLIARTEALRDVQKLLDGPLWHDEFDHAKFDAQQGRTMWGHDIRFCKRLMDVGQMEGASQKWQNYTAGWIQCMHFDIDTQTMFGLPRNAPCFQGNINTEAYWDYLHKYSGHEAEAVGTAYLKLHERICELVPEGANVVDMGCGIGVLLDRLTKKKRVRGFGYDISPKAIEMLNSRWLEGEVCDAKDFQLNHFPPKETILVSTETIEHLDDERYEQFMKEAAKSHITILSTPDGHINAPEGEHVREFDGRKLKADLSKRFTSVHIEKVEPHFLLAVCSNEEAAIKHKPKRKARRGKEG
jgi:2-polyprenyl-3-methyl-5-hydroxy-6-metoxy-1,4-benzoquinol methylase